MDFLEPGAAKELFLQASALPEIPCDVTEQAEGILRVCRGLPLPLKLAGGAVGAVDDHPGGVKHWQVRATGIAAAGC